MTDLTLFKGGVSNELLTKCWRYAACKDSSIARGAGKALF
jgi:hypothetical protein